MLIPLLIFCALYAVACVFVIASSWTMSRKIASLESDLQHHGTTVTGQLDGHTSANLSFTYLPFTYDYAGKTYKQRQWVSKHSARVFLDATSIEILLLPDKPEIAMLADISPDHQESRVLKNRARTALISLCLALPLLGLLWAINH